MWVTSSAFDLLATQLIVREEDVEIERLTIEDDVRVEVDMPFRPRNGRSMSSSSKIVSIGCRTMALLGHLIEHLEDSLFQGALAAVSTLLLSFRA